MGRLESLIAGRLAGRHRRVIKQPGQRPAAVLVPLYERGSDGQPGVLLTKRTQSVEHHKGQISFPGGAADPADADPLVTALRETEEELGIAPEHVHVLGALDDVPTVVSGFIITPFVGMIPYPYPLRINAEEIAEVLEVPLSVFLDRTRVRVEERQRGDERVKVYFYYHGPHEIWGATARILKEFIDIVFTKGSDPL